MSSSVPATLPIDYIARGICLLMSSQCINSLVNTQGGECRLLDILLARSD